MTTARPQFLSCDPITGAPASAPSDSEAVSFWILGHSQHQKLTEAIPTEVLESATQRQEITLVPIGAEGEWTWHRLPRVLAPLIGPVTNTAFVLVPQESAQLIESQNLWEDLATDNSSLAVRDTILSNQFLAPELPDLAPSHRRLPSWLRSRISTFRPERVISAPDEHAIRAGLLQIHDQLEPSHVESQHCQGDGVHVAGDYWHGIMHRREPDYHNSKYWFRRVGEHPCFPQLAEIACDVFDNTDDSQSDQWNVKLTSSGWNPNGFVDLCEQTARLQGTPLELAARRIQWFEMILLLSQTFTDCTGES
ncbi:hypothetical protein AB1L42_08430 [Thalassoglobus sp. JC818]|uniref:hypothetical protein n=1 Tax=Thalassoglobus sp. JC818 TaxID=3232136 RepID=UPI00345B3C6D